MRLSLFFFGLPAQICGRRNKGRPAVCIRVCDGVRSQHSEDAFRDRREGRRAGRLDRMGVLKEKEKR